MTDNDYSEADYEEAYGILDDGYEKWSTQYDEDPDYGEIHLIDGEEVSEDVFYETLGEIIERERQEDALDAAQSMEEDELRDEYFRGLEFQEWNEND